MKRLIVYLVILILAVWVGLILKSDPGYLLVAYQDWTVETSLWFGVVIVFVGFALVYHLIRFVKILFESHGHLIKWYRQKKFLKAHTLTGSGLLALEEAQWEDAEELLLRGVSHSHIPVINYINAARASQHQGEDKKRDQYLNKALALAEQKEKLAVYLASASLKIEHHQYKQARDTLEKLLTYKSKHPYVLKLLQLVYKKQEDWDSLLALLPRLRERRILDQEEEAKLEIMTYSNLFIAKDKPVGALQKIWRGLPKSMKQTSQVVEPYIERLLQAQLEDEAEKIISLFMEQTFSNCLVKTYGKLTQIRAGRRFKKAKQWLQQYGESAVLLTTLGYISFQENDLDNALVYAEKSIELEENIEAYALLAKVYEAQDREYSAEQARAKALALLDS